MNPCSNSKFPNIPYTTNISRRKYFNSFCEIYMRVLEHFNTENYT